METDGAGAGFWVRECVPLFLSRTKTIDFFFPPALSEELRNISFQHPPHGHDTWSRVCPGPSGGAPRPEGNRARRAAEAPLSPSCLHAANGVAMAATPRFRRVTSPQSLP